MTTRASRRHRQGGLTGRTLGLLASVTAALTMFAALAGSASAEGAVSCRTYTGLPVALGAGQPAEYSIAGELCATPRELASGETVQLLIHGATYNHSYWDFGTIDRVTYSYARDVAAAGYPTFAIDEIGTGASSHPPSAEVTIQSAAYVAHEMVQDLLNGQIARTRFARVIEVGHSFGSLTAWEEAATYHDVAGVIVTGAAHSDTVFSNNILGDTYPAVDDPRFADSGLDSGYLTTLPGVRGSVFYSSADSDPNVISRDEATKDVISAAELETGLPLEETTLTRSIDVPVLVILGGNDKLYCGADEDGQTFDCSSGQAVVDQEASYYSSQAQLRACVVPASGHDLNLALNHDLEEADALAWSYEYVGQHGAAVARRILPPDCSS